jgi:cryptochrome
MTASLMKNLLSLFSSAPNQGQTSIHWFRKDLRLHDNPSLLASIKSCSTFYPVYILDIEACRRSKISANRWNFLCECLQDLDSELRAIGSRLYVVRGRVMEVLPRLFSEWGATRLSFETDNEPAGRQRDEAVNLVAKKFEVQVVSHNSHLLYDVEDLKEAYDGRVPLTLDEFVKVVGGLKKPTIPGQPIDRSVLQASMAANVKDDSSVFGVPDITEFGIKDPSMATGRGLWKGGETEALKRLSLALKKVKTENMTFCPAFV